MPTTQITRRSILKKAAAGAALAVAAPSIIPSSALGDSTAAAPSERLTFGFIGMGKQMGGHLGYISGRKDAQVIGVCDVDTTRRQHALDEVAKKYKDLERKGECVGYNDFHELIAKKELDAVVIATPEHWHTIPIIKAAKAGKDIYCEKPLTLTLHEAKTVIDVVRKYNRILQTGSQQRTWPEFKKAVQYVRAGRIGQIKTVTVGVGGPSKPCDLPEEAMEPGLDWERWLGPAPLRPYNSILSPRGIHKHFPAWRQYREYANGGLSDIGAHHFDIAQWGMNMDKSGPVEIIPPEKPGAGTGCKFIYANGIEMTHGGPSGITFNGTEGTIYVTRGKTTSTPEKIYETPITEAEEHAIYLAKDNREDWVNCIRSRKLPICDVEIGARSVAICILGALAYQYGRKMKWDPQAWEFPGDAEANGWRDRARRGTYQLPAL